MRDENGATMRIETQDDLHSAVKQIIKWRRLYEAQKAVAANTALWLEGYRRLTRESCVFDFDRLLEILEEIEAEGDS